MAGKVSVMDDKRVNKGLDPELREAEREINHCSSRECLSCDHFAKITDYIDKSITEAIKRTLSEMQGRDKAVGDTDRPDGGQPTFLQDEQRLKDSLVTRVRENGKRIQWRNSHH